MIHILAWTLAILTLLAVLGAIGPLLNLLEHIDRRRARSRQPDPDSRPPVQAATVPPMRRIGVYGIGPRIEHIPRPECIDCRLYEVEGRLVRIMCAIHAQPDLNDDLHLWDRELRDAT